MTDITASFTGNSLVDQLARLAYRSLAAYLVALASRYAPVPTMLHDQAEID